MDKNNLILYSAGILILLFYLIFFQLTGLRFILGVFVLYLIPMYLILDNFDLKKPEKAVFSFFIGIGIYPSLVYWIGYFVGSVRVAIVLAFALLVGTGAFLKLLKKKDKSG